MDSPIDNKKFVGQQKAIELLNLWKRKNSFPHFLIVCGASGSGRKSYSKLFAQFLNAQIVPISDITVNGIRNLIEIAYTLDSKIVYLISDADNMSISARNALLKLTEEPPQNAYIIITLTSLDNTLYTLRSRSQHVVMEPYSTSDLRTLSNNDTLCELSETPGMLKQLESMDDSMVNDLIDLSSKLVYYVTKVSLPNALKSSTKIKFKDTDKGFDLNMIFAAIQFQIDKALSNIDDVEDVRILQCWTRTLSNMRYQFERSGVNKKALYDRMIMAVRNYFNSGVY